MTKNIIVWNCHEASHKSFVNQVRIVIGGFHPKILLLLEIRIPSYKGKGI